MTAHVLRTRLSREAFDVTPHRRELFGRHFDQGDGCWMWRGGNNGHGYGVFGIQLDGRPAKVYAHRYAYTIHVGPIPNGMEIDHTCHNRGCVNPSHLRVVTRKQNTENLRGGSGRSGIRGVSWVKRRRMWRAYATHNRRMYEAGCYPTVEEAAEAAARLRNSLFTHNIEVTQ